jgi:hypothetical protein
MATTYSEEMTNILATPPVPLTPLDHAGKLRLARVTYTQVANGSAGDIIQMCKLPAGRVTVHGLLSNLYINLATASMKCEIGWAAYTGLDGVAVDADPNGLDSTLDVEAAGIFNIGLVLVAVGSVKTFESQEGVILTLTATTDVAASDNVIGFIAYVAD